MSTFLLFGNYTTESLKKISDRRTREIIEAAQQMGGEIKRIYALLGAFDLILIAQFPTLEKAAQFSTAAAQTLGVSFITMPVVPVLENW